MAQTIFAEIRPRIQACSIFITTDNDRSLNKMRTLNIKPNSINITWQTESSTWNQQIVLPGCKLVPNTLSCLQVESEFISFRVQTEPYVGFCGSFAREILQVLPDSSKETGDNHATTPTVVANSTCSLSCRCCNSSLAEHYVQRVLPLPTGSLDVCEWFCHDHGSPLVLKPQLNDLLYGCGYIVVSKVWFQASAMSSSSKKVIRCRRCLSWLGTCDSTSVTLWNCTISTGESLNTSPLQDFIRSVVNAITSCVGLMCRVVVEMKLSDVETHYLLLWVIDKNLQVLTNSDFKISEHSIDNDSVMITELKPQNTVKLLYLHQPLCSTVVKAWQDDVSVQQIEVAKPMFTEGLDHLRKMTNLLPYPYRITNDYFTAYLNI